MKRTPSKLLFSDNVSETRVSLDEVGVFGKAPESWFQVDRYELRVKFPDDEAETLKVFDSEKFGEAYDEFERAVAEAMRKVREWDGL